MKKNGLFLGMLVMVLAFGMVVAGCGDGAGGGDGDDGDDGDGGGPGISDIPFGDLTSLESKWPGDELSDDFGITGWTTNPLAGGTYEGCKYEDGVLSMIWTGATDSHYASIKTKLEALTGFSQHEEGTDESSNPKTYMGFFGAEGEYVAMLIYAKAAVTVDGNSIPAQCLGLAFYDLDKVEGEVWGEVNSDV
jgi:hypothetical protein